MGTDSEELDRLLDGAIAGYSAQEPRPGLEKRVLAGVGTLPSGSGWLRRSRSWFAPGFRRAALCALATALVAVGWVGMTGRRGHAAGPPARPLALVHPGVARSLASGSEQPFATAKRPTVAASASALRHRVVEAAARRVETRRRGADSQPDVFPTPSPLTAEERALLALATRVPADVQRALSNSAQEAAAPLRIAALQIAPLPPLTPPPTRPDPTSHEPTR